MTTGKAKGKDIEMLVQDTPPVSYDMAVPKTSCTKKRIRRIADPHIEGRKINSRLYYYYRRGSDSPIYLGSADTILSWKKERDNSHTNKDRI